MSFFRSSKDRCSQSTFLASADVAAGAGSAALGAPVPARATDRNARQGRTDGRFIELISCCWGVSPDVSPDLHAAIDDDVDARHVRALFAGEGIDDQTPTGLEVGPRRAHQIEDQVHLVATVAVPPLVADVL